MSSVPASALNDLMATAFAAAAPLSIAIVGSGPRGLAAAEALAARVGQTGQPIALTIIDNHGAPGAGPNYDPAQSGLNRLNIPLRAISIPSADYRGALEADFTQWLEQQDKERDQDAYPARKDLGAYLSARFSTLHASPPSGMTIALYKANAVDLQQAPDGWRVKSDGITFGPFGSVLLALGHQSTTDPQVVKWRDHAAKTGAIFAPAYPDSALMTATRDWSEKTVAIRGLGLSTIDVVRLLTLGLDGTFDDHADELSYRPSGREPRAILPFSLDGIPPAPKPASAEIDALYDLAPEVQDAFIAGLEGIIKADSGDPLPDLSTLLVEIGASTFAHLGIAARDAQQWLAIECDRDAEHPIDARPVREILAHHLGMARGDVPPSAGYGIGQVWRKLQTPLRKAYNPLAVPRTTAENLVRFDEGLKRFSYGPPARAISEMIALIDCGLLDLRAADDPDIVVCKTGWRLGGDESDTIANVMIDAVLPAADLDKCDAPLIENLKGKGLLSPAGAKLGARILPDGTAIDAAGNPVPGLALLGRMATGSVIATDSVHDCFGASAGRWALAVLEQVRHRED